MNVVGHGGIAAAGNFTSLQIADTAWAFAKAGTLDAQLFTVLMREAGQRICNFDAQALVKTA